jgi:uncharacterized protein YoxC
MSVDDVVKLILAISFAISLVGVSIQIMRLLSKTTSILNETQEGVRNAVKLTTTATEDYMAIRNQIVQFMSIFNGLRETKESIKKVVGMVGSVSPMFGKKDKGSDTSDTISE